MQYIWERGALPKALTLEVLYDDFPVTGLSPTVEVYRFSDDAYVDWATSTFVSSGGTRFGSLSGVPSNSGLYRRHWNPTDFGQTTDAIYYMRYKATVPSGFQSLLD